MNSNSILQSDLLDIIFENRNKEYGAYDLRKGYNKRLQLGLAGMCVLIIAFIILQLFNGKENYKKESNIVIDNSVLSSFSFDQPKIIKPKSKSSPQIKSPKKIAEIPVIVRDDKKHKETPVSKSMDFSDQSNADNISYPDASEISSAGNDTVGKAKGIKPSLPEVNLAPTSSPDVMPQYPGGLDEFLKFMRRNLRTPRDLEENEKVAVRITFVVNYDGALQDFNIVESGSKIFDDEVIRVLKKMPKWIPGKNRSGNVPVYFTLPVKFNNE